MPKKSSKVIDVEPVEKSGPVVAQDGPQEIECTHYVKVLDRVGVALSTLNGITPVCVQYIYQYQFTTEEDAIRWAEAFEAKFSHISASVHEAKKPFVYKPKAGLWQDG